MTYTYYLHAGSSDIQTIGPPFDKIRILARETMSTPPSETFTVPGGSSINLYFLTPEGTPSSDNWEDGGTFTCEWSLSTTSVQLRTRVRVGRVDTNTSTIVQLGAFTAFKTHAASTVLTFTPTVPTWTDAEESCRNRIIVQYQINNTNPMNNRNFTVQFGSTDAEVISTITEVNGTCRRIFNG